MVTDAAASLNLPRIIEPRRHVDDRGWFSEIFHEQGLRNIGITCRFVQDNQSYSKQAGTLRGLHFQLPPAAQAKLVMVAKGRVLDVVVDIRNGSPSFGRYVSPTLPFPQRSPNLRRHLKSMMRSERRSDRADRTGP